MEQYTSCNEGEEKLLHIVFYINFTAQLKNVWFNEFRFPYL